MLLLKFGSSVVLLIGLSSAWTFIVSFIFALSVFVFVSPAMQAYGDASRAAQAVTNAKVARTSSRREVWTYVWCVVCLVDASEELSSHFDFMFCKLCILSGSTVRVLGDWG
jgi:hypothetical protein